MQQMNTSGDNPVTWDAEEDHMLSYFLGDTHAASQQQSHGAIPMFATSESNRYASADTIASALEHGPPSTPAVHFYSSSPSTNPRPTPAAAATTTTTTTTTITQQQPPPQQQPLQTRPASVVSTSSSSSSLSSMAATLVSGGPVMQQLHAHQQRAVAVNNPTTNNPTNTTTASTAANTGSAATTTPPTAASPISPAAALQAQEQLMLPPPPRYGEKSEAEKQHHRAWLQQINSMAMMRNPQVVVPGMPAGYQLAPVMYHHPHHPQPPAAAAGALVRYPPVESEEKRARRLARNRESARQSRRRKKEHLAMLEGKVNKLHTAIEDERRQKLDVMEKCLRQCRDDAISQLLAKNDNNSSEEAQELYHILQATGPNSVVRQNAISFQYNTLRQTVLPNYRELILWLTAQQESFFTAGKEQRSKTETGKGSNSARVSSKQIGEEIYSAWKKKKRGNSDNTEDSPRSAANEAARMWPLFCYEMSISVDQEEKMVAFHKRCQDARSLPEDRIQVHNAGKMAMNLKKGLLLHTHATAARSENTLLRILSPQQAAKFLQWSSRNRERWQQKLQAPDQQQQQALADASSLADLCKRLDDALRLPSSPR